jgi:hypothetical protein
MILETLPVGVTRIRGSHFILRSASAVGVLAVPMISLECICRVVEDVVPSCEGGSANSDTHRDVAHCWSALTSVGSIPADLGCGFLKSDDTGGTGTIHTASLGHIDASAERSGHMGRGQNGTIFVRKFLIHPRTHGVGCDLFRGITSSIIIAPST